MVEIIFTDGTSFTCDEDSLYTQVDGDDIEAFNYYPMNTPE
jgi:hypothetical protein